MWGKSKQIPVNVDLVGRKPEFAFIVDFFQVRRAYQTFADDCHVHKLADQRAVLIRVEVKAVVRELGHELSVRGNCEGNRVELPVRPCVIQRLFVSNSHMCGIYFDVDECHLATALIGTGMAPGSFTSRHHHSTLGILDLHPSLHRKCRRTSRRILSSCRSLVVRGEQARKASWAYAGISLDPLSAFGCRAVGTAFNSIFMEKWRQR